MNPDTETALRLEADFFDKVDNQKSRDTSWASLQYFQKKIGEASRVGPMTKEHLKGRQNIKSLTMACGDMAGEYVFLKNMGVHFIDAFDISPGQRDKFFNRVNNNPEVPVNYQIADINAINLKEEQYDIIYIQEAYHHFNELEHIAKEINKALKPDGIFVLIDYIGKTFLQRSERLRELSDFIWKQMPAKHRTDLAGTVFAEPYIPPKSTLSPYEAIRSEEILDVLTDTFNFQHLYQFAGIIFSLFNGFAHTYDDSEEDTQFIRDMWDLDRILIESNLIEPNFVRAIMTKR